MKETAPTGTNASDEKSMSESSCEGFEIVIEMRRHAAADAAAFARLDAHLAGCESCRSYERFVVGSDEALRRRTEAADGSMDWDGLLRRMSSARRNFLYSGVLAAALWSVIIGVLWLAHSGDLKIRILEPLPRTLPVLIPFTIFGVGVHAGLIVWALRRRSAFRAHASAPTLLAAYRRDLALSVRLGTWSFGAVVLLLPFIAYRWSRWRGPLDPEAVFSLLCQCSVIGLSIYFYFVRRPRLLREDSELARFDGNVGGTP